MKHLLLIAIAGILVTVILPTMFGIYSGCDGTKFIHPPNDKKELLERHLGYIKEGYVIQGFPHDGWFVSMYPSAQDKGYPKKIFNFFYKWSVYYNFKWFDKC